MDFNSVGLQETSWFFSWWRLKLLTMGLLGNSWESSWSNDPLVTATGLLSQLESFISTLVQSGDQVLEVHPRLLEMGEEFIRLVEEMSALQELHLLDMMSTFFQQHTDAATRQLIFSTIFNVKDHWAQKRRISLFGKLVSLSVVLDRSVVSECAAAWLQRTDRESHLHLGQVLVDDYVPGLVSVLQNIKRASPRLCCQFIIAVAAGYDLSSAELTPPLELVHMFVSWIQDDPGLVLITLLSTPLSNGQPINTLHVTPLEGLVCWCVKAPLVYRSMKDKDRDRDRDTELIFSALHLSCLKIFQLLPNLLVEKGVWGQVSLLQLGSMAKVTSDLSKLLHRAENDPEASAACVRARSSLSLERLAQSLQLATVCRVLICSREELSAICCHLPYNTLLQLVLTGPVVKDAEETHCTEGGADPPLPPVGQEQVDSEEESFVAVIADT